MARKRRRLSPEQEAEYAALRDAAQQRAESLRPWLAPKSPGQPFVNKQRRRNGVAEREPIPPAQRARILRRDRGTCRYCGNFDGLMHIDHVVPVTLGGRSIDGNLVTACADCNLRKGIRLWTPLTISAALAKRPELDRFRG